MRVECDCICMPRTITAFPRKICGLLFFVPGPGTKFSGPLFYSYRMVLEVVSPCGWSVRAVGEPRRGFYPDHRIGGCTPACVPSPRRGFPSVLFTGGYTPGCTLTPLRGYFFALLMALGPSRVGVTGTMRPFLSKVRRSMQTSRWMPGSLCRKCLLMRW